MEDEVKDAVISGQTDDGVLLRLINLVVASINRNKDVFPNILEEPLPFQTFQRWVVEGLEDKAKIDAIHDKTNYVGDASR